MDHIIHVTKYDIDNCCYGDNYDCAIAKGLKREFPNSKILVGGHYFCIRGIYIKFSPKLKKESDRIYTNKYPERHFEKPKPFWFRVRLTEEQELLIK